MVVTHLNQSLQQAPEICQSSSGIPRVNATNNPSMSINRENLLNLDYDNHSAHRELYNHIKEAILPNVHENDYPPLHLLTYAIRNIIYPTLLHTQIPDVLQLLAHVDSLRRKVVSEANRALLWNSYFKRHPHSGVSPLSDDEEVIVARFASKTKDTANRLTYRWLKYNYCRLDIYYLWKTQDIQLLPHAMQYFPQLYLEDEESSPEPSEQPKPARPVLHYDILDNSEQNEVHNTGMECARFVHDADQFRADPASYCRSKGIPLADFQACFPVPVEEKILVDITVWYIKKVEQMAFGLEDIFHH